MNGSGRPTWPVLGLGAVALFGVLALAGVPLGSLFILGVLLTCPLMMAGMHRGSGHNGHNGHDVNSGDQRIQERRGPGYLDPTATTEPRPDGYEPLPRARGERGAR